MRSRRPKLGATELRYRRALRAALAKMQAEIERAVLAWRADSAFSDALRRVRRSRLVVDPEELETVARRTERAAGEQTKRLIGIAPRVSKRTIDRWRKENTDLIVTLQGKQIERITTILQRGRNLRVEELRSQMQLAFGIEKRHADLLARDQTLKLNAQITREQHERAGVKSYTWSTSLDERVRDRHRELEGRVFSYDDPPIIDPRTGERGHPGDDYQCRCVAIPVVDFLADEGGGPSFQEAVEPKRARKMFDDS